jgi:HlyD family secretion protein
VIDFKTARHWVVLVGVVLLGIGGAAWGIVSMKRGMTTQEAKAGERDQAQPEEQEPEQHDTKVQVKVVHPKKGATERLATQPGSIQAYESVRLFAKVPGFLKQQNVDIGDRVKKGAVLAVIDVPELEAQLKRNKAAVKQAGSRVDQMEARVASAKADLIAAKAAVTRAEATAKSAAAWVRYRQLQLRRMEALVLSKSIEQKLEDEAKEHYEASKETELAAKETITANKAKVDASQAKISQAKADVEEAKAEVEVAQAELERVQVQIAFATIPAPFDGVIAQRNFFPGDYIRSANEGGNNEPLLMVHKTDMMRVVVQIPDRDVPFTDPGDSAEVHIDALPGRVLQAKVSRIANFEDPQTRLMRVELDLPNPTGKICHGMYGQVTIVLDQEKELLSIPSSCLVGKHDAGKGTVYVVRDGHAHEVSVRLGTDDGLRVVVLGGLDPNDEVIVQPGNRLSDGVQVILTK